MSGFTNNPWRSSSTSSNYELTVGDQQTIQQVIDKITDAASNKVYNIFVPPGHEDEKYTGKSYVVINEYNKKQIITADYPNNDNILIGGFEATNEWTNAGSPTLSLDTTRHLQGDACLKAVSNGDATFELNKTGTWDFTGYDFSLFAQVINVKYFYIIFYSGSDRVEYRYVDATTLTMGSMFPIELVKSLPTASVGDPIDWSAITRIRLLIIPPTGESSTLYIDNFVAIKTYPHPLAILRFDDGTIDHYDTVRPILETFGYKGVMGIYTEKIGSGSSLSEQQIKDFDTSGWDTVSHTHTHPHFGSITNKQITQELLRSKRIIENLGVTKGSRFFILPFGKDTDLPAHALSEIKKYYSMNFLNKTVRGGMLVNKGSLYHLADIACTSAIMSTVHSLITDLSEQNGLVVLLIHTVKTSGGNITPTELTALCQHLKDSGVRVVTASELYDDILQGKHATATSLSSSTKVVVEETLTGAKTIEPFEGDHFYLDPGGANRDIAIIDSHNAGVEITIVNTADAAEVLTFDPLFTSSGTSDNTADLLTFSTGGWTTNQLVGRTVNNTTDSSSGVITANTATTITAILTGGTNDTWTAGDSFTITPVGSDQDVTQGNLQTFIYDGEGWH